MRSICRMRFRMSTAGTAAAIRRCCLTCAAREICFRRSGGCFVAIMPRREKQKRGCKKWAFLHPFKVYFDVKLAARRICNHLQLGQLPDSSSGEPQFTQKRGFCSSVGVAGVVVTGVATGAAVGAAAALF